MSIIKSPLRYPGGKNKIADQIASMAPSFKEYREPLIGGGSVYFANRQSHGDNKKYWINDLNYELYNFWKVCQKDIDYIVNKATEYKGRLNNNGKELHRFLRRNIGVFDNKNLAAAYFTLNRIVFGGGPLVSSPTQQHVDRFRTLDIKDHFNGIHNILKNTRITNLDYQKVVEAPPGEGIRDEDVYIFLDPPYYSATDSGLYGKNDKWRNLHKIFDHQRFVTVMKECKHKFLITYDDHPMLRKLFSWANIIEFKLQYGFGLKNGEYKIGNEIFISNYEFPKSKQLNIDDAWE